MDKIQQFWNEFCQENHNVDAEYKDAFQFGGPAEWLAGLVVEGKKRATCSGLVFYEIEKEEIPQAGEYYIVLNEKDEPVAVIKIKSVEIVPMNEVTEEFALAEGEGDYHFWWEAHEKFFTESLKEYGKEFSPDMLLVCERFEKVYPK
ncbi:ASCH domain-containing protein [Jeotgalibacillus proteolyticus]|uniref:ASCH domain-containing protein n=1 Tax=Jeotgalibacillus proteolyticus TaxID=2082395 RepID=A0A2S5G952_9BACL|nr:ASCH domain-containing protein [Jeotgalibacillus proteolyticus]PPA69537.1 ASCH domain-containing protein [Jeotgalibacillus proteolyticus]